MGVFLIPRNAGGTISFGRAFSEIMMTLISGIFYVASREICGIAAKPLRRLQARLRVGMR